MNTPASIRGGRSKDAPACQSSGGVAVNRILVQCDPDAIKVALLEDGRLTECYTQAEADRQTVGNIYKGRVVNVLPGMDAAFVDIGQSKNAFLYIDDLLPAHLEKQPKVKPSIRELVHEGQDIVVQIVKEALGSKGARVTTHFSLPGRWIVYMPGADYVGVSRKIASDTERQRLRDLAEAIRRPGEGLILRTVAAGEPDEAIVRDLERLREQWDEILRRAETAPAPSIVYHELDMLPRLIRDIVNDDIEELVIDSEKVGRLIADELSRLSPHLAERVRIDRAAEPIFQRYGVGEQLEKAFRPKVWLDNGSYLVVDQTEALTVIDVNTGKYTGSIDLEETVFATNREAAEEIARLLRLRDIGGIIIIDFIDMELEEHRAAVLRTLEEAIRRDRTKCIVVGWTRLGLLEMTRKKVRDNVDLAAIGVCPMCGGSGRAPNR
jgi:ribonuclease G